MDGQSGDRQTVDIRERYRVNQDPDNIIPRIRNFCLDMDGTVYLDSTWIDGAKDFLAALTATGRTYCFMTNNSSKSAGIYVEKLLNMGLVIDPETQLITSGHATAEYLKRTYPGKKIYLFGNPMVKMEFEERGVLIDEEHPDVVVTSFCTSFHYRDLCKLCDLVREGLPYVATHPDFNCPTKTGFIPAEDRIRWSESRRQRSLTMRSRQWAGEERNPALWETVCIQTSNPASTTAYMVYLY